VGPINRAAAEAELRDADGSPLFGPTFDLVTAATRAVEGTVRDAATGKPLAGMRVSTLVGYDSPVMATTDAQGRYRLAGLPKRGEYLLLAAPPAGSGYLSGGARPKDAEGLKPLTADVVLARGITVTGRLFDKATGKGVPGGLRFAPLPGNPYF